MATLESTIPTVARFNFRLPAEIKDRIEKAAIASGLTVTDFAINVLAESADEVLEKQRSRTLSTRDSDVFLAMLDDESEPNNALKKAAADYKRRVTSK